MDTPESVSVVAATRALFALPRGSFSEVSLARARGLDDAPSRVSLADALVASMAYLGFGLSTVGARGASAPTTWNADIGDVKSPGAAASLGEEALLRESCGRVASC